MKYTHIVATAAAVLVSTAAGAVVFFFKKGKKKEHKDMKNSEFPMDEDGRTYHLNTKKGEGII
jgi:cbb3-type cytochrome oxidase subunit 3